MQGRLNWSLRYHQHFSLFVKGTALEAKSGKIVSGLEPENTNATLLALAECASNASYDNAEAVGRCLAGILPGQGPPPLKSGGGSAAAAVPSIPLSARLPLQAEEKSDFKSESKSDKGDSAPSGSKTAREDVKSMAEKAQAQSTVQDVDSMLAPAPERGRSRGGTRGGKPAATSAAPAVGSSGSAQFPVSSLSSSSQSQLLQQPMADVGLGGRMSVSNIPNLDGEIERCDGLESTTQTLLGELITKPKLSDKLLAKPPFRFLFDIVMEVIKVTVRVL